MMKHDEDNSRDHAEAEDAPGVRWRPWPCAGCCGGTTPLGFLVRGFGSSPQVPERGRNEVIDAFKKWESERLLRWIEGCPHTQWQDLQLPQLAEGSEHSVLFDEAVSEVVKITLPGTYGDYYEIIDGQIHQFDSTPAEYLLRLRWWEKLFSTAPSPLGMTESGQVLSRQKFISGSPPRQEDVDQFLGDAGTVPVRQRCWLWKKTDVDPEIEVWIGDARSDNFVFTEQGIIPIDIRIWGVPIQPGAVNRTTS